MSDKQYNFLEIYLIKFIVSVQLGILLGFQFQGTIHNKPPFIDAFIKALGEALKSNESILITIASIFIGIYFTIFTLLGSITTESTFASIKKNNFDKFVKFIKHAFIGAFVYLFYSIVISIVEKYTKSIDPYLTIFLFVLLTYMLLSSFRLGSIVYLIYQKDLSKIHETIEFEKNEKAQVRLIMHRLDQYLIPIELEQSKENAQKMKDFINMKKSEIDSSL